MRDLKLLSIKMAVASTLSFIIANFLGIGFAISSGVVAILSIQETKKSTIVVAKKRILAAIIGITLSSVIYLVIGQNVFSFFIFILIFSYIVLKKNIEEGLAVTVVLSTHLYLSDISYMWIINEFLILFIGIFIASIINLFMPSLEDEFDKNKKQVEILYKRILESMANSLVTHTVNIDEEVLFIDTGNIVKKLDSVAHRICENRLIEGDYYYISYSNMRVNQFNTLIRMRRHFERFYISYDQTKMIEIFTKKISNNIGEKNDCINLLDELNEIRKIMKNMQLPKTREEFENRALLYQYINDLEEFLTIKHVFIKSVNNS